MENEEIYLKAYETMFDAKKGIGDYLTHYNSRRPHQALEMKTSDQAYFEGLELPIDA